MYLLLNCSNNNNSNPYSRVVKKRRNKNTLIMQNNQKNKNIFIILINNLLEKPGHAYSWIFGDWLVCKCTHLFYNWDAIQHSIAFIYSFFEYIHKYATRSSSIPFSTSRCERKKKKNKGKNRGRSKSQHKQRWGAKINDNK